MHRVTAAAFAVVMTAAGLTFTAIFPAHGWPVGAHWRLVGVLLSLLGGTFVWGIYLLQKPFTRAAHSQARPAPGA